MNITESERVLRNTEAAVSNSYPTGEAINTILGELDRLRQCRNKDLDTQERLRTQRAEAVAVLRDLIQLPCLSVVDDRTSIYDLAALERARAVLAKAEKCRACGRAQSDCRCGEGPCH